MRGVLRAFVVLQVLLPLCAFAADENVLVELNSIESADNRCRLNFVVQNKSRVAIESMKPAPQDAEQHHGIGALDEILIH